MPNLLDTLKERIVVFDGAMGTNLQVQNLTLDDFGGPRFEGCNENLLVTRPDAVEKVHSGFLDVGCDVIETNSFNGTPVDFAEYDIGDKAYDMNVLAAQLAKRVASDYSTKEKPRWVAGSMGPGRKLPTLGHISFSELRDAYSVQVRGLLDGGVDLLIVETCQDVLQTKAALAAIFAHFKETRRRVPVIAQVTIEVFGTMLNGTEISAALTALAPFPIDVVGMNCGTGPKHMTESIRYICENSPLPVSVLPNAGLPSVVEGKMHYDETPESFTAQLVHFANDFGANIVGGCCGTTPAHLRLVVEAMQRITPKQRARDDVAGGFFDLHATALRAGCIVFDCRRARQCERLEEDARSAQRGRLGWSGCARQGTGARRRAHSRRERRLCGPRRRTRHARAGFAARHKHQAPADVRLHRVAEDGSRTSARGRQIDSEFNQL